MATFDEAFADEPNETVDSVDANTLDESPADGGQGESEGTGTDSGTAPNYFDLDQYGDQVVKIKVDGAEQDVPLAELRNGYMRQEAFTQKTQSLAEERQQLEAANALATAYRQNPAETVRFLAEQNGLTLAQAAAVAESAESDDWGDTGAVEEDPRIAMFEQRFAALDAREARMELESTISELGNRYEDFNPNEVITRAIELQSDDLEGVYKMMAFDRMQATQNAKRQFDENAATGDATATAAKAALAGQVATGESFAGAGDGLSAPVTSVSQALDAAMAASGDLW